MMSTIFITMTRCKWQVSTLTSTRGNRLVRVRDQTLEKTWRHQNLRRQPSSVRTNLSSHWSQSGPVAPGDRYTRRLLDRTSVLVDICMLREKGKNTNYVAASGMPTITTSDAKIFKRAGRSLRASADYIQKIDINVVQCMQVTMYFAAGYFGNYFKTKHLKICKRTEWFHWGCTIRAVSNDFQHSAPFPPTGIILSTVEVRCFHP